MHTEGWHERLAAFRDPDRRYAVYQIIHGGACDQSRVAHYDERWFGGIVGNIQYTRGFPDDPTIWQNVDNGMRAYIDRGMHTWLYDENGYPSGTAGGYVTEMYPEHIAKGLYCYDYWRKIGGPGIYRADVPGDKLWKAVLIPIDGGEVIDVTHCLNERNVLYVDVPAGSYYLFMMSIRRLFDGTHATESYSEPRNYISLSDKKAVETFIGCTHEKYKEVLGDQFGRGVLAMFTDEPSLISWNIRRAVFPILPWLDSYPDDFADRYGYEFYRACVAVVTGKGPQVTKRRCDFWEFIADTVAENYFGTIQDWCHANGLKSSGHMLEEERLQAHIYNYGSFYRSMRRFDWPGIDQLQTETGALMNDNAIPIARFIASFADINGEHEVFTEFSDHCVRERGEVAGLDCYYGSVNWHLAMGANNFTSYYSWDGITKEETIAFNRYTARSGYLLRQGCRDSRVAIYYPEAAMWSSYTPSTEARAIDHSAPTKALEKAFVRSSWALLHKQVDFDYIDTTLLCQGEIRDGKLCYRDRSYHAIVIPCARVLEESVMEKLLTLAKTGVTILFCEELPKKSRETGEATPLADQIQTMVDTGEMLFATADQFDTLLAEKLPLCCRTITIDDNDPMLLSHCRITEDGLRIVYIANMADTPYTGDLHIEGTYTDTRQANAFTGEITPVSCTTAEGRTHMPITIQPGEGRFFLLQN